jgi:hypothetical protein
MFVVFNGKLLNRDVVVLLFFQPNTNKYPVPVLQSAFPVLPRALFFNAARTLLENLRRGRQLNLVGANTSSSR